MTRPIPARAGLVALLAVATACGGSSRTPSPLPVPAAPPAAPKPAPASAPNVAAPAPHPFAYGAGVYRYEVRGETIVSAPGTDRVDTVTTRAVVTYRMTPRDSGLVAIQGTVDSFTVTRSGTSAPTPTPLSAALPFTLTTTPDGTLHGSAPLDSAGVCTTPLEPVVASSRELVVAIPVALAPDAQWTDSLVTVTCRGTLPVTARSERHSRATWVAVPTDWSRRAGDAAFEISRTTATSLAGDGRAAGRQVAVTGTGEGNSALYVDPELGVLLGAVGNSSTRLIVDTGTQRQEFLQTVRQRVRLLR